MISNEIKIEWLPLLSERFGRSIEAIVTCGIDNHFHNTVTVHQPDKTIRYFEKAFLLHGIKSNDQAFAVFTESEGYHYFDIPQGRVLEEKRIKIGLNQDGCKWICIEYHVGPR